MTMLCGERNHLQPTNFNLIIDRVNYPSLNYYVNSFSHASVSLNNTTNFTYKRITNVPIIGDSIDYGTVTFDVIIDEDMNSYTEIYDWMNRLVDNKYVAPYNDTDALPSSEEDLVLLIYTSADTVNKKIVYKNAFPTALGEIQFNSTTTDPEVITVPVTFAFTYFTIE